jgi:Ribonuclease G/E
MKSKDYLEQIRILDRLINNKLQELEQLEALATKVTSVNSGDRVQASGSQDKMADTVIKILELKQEINADIDRLVDLKCEIIPMIDAVQDADLIDVLYKRYIQGKKWEEIALEMHYTFRWVLKLHGRALQKIDMIRKEKI